MGLLWRSSRCHGRLDLEPSLARWSFNTCFSVAVAEVADIIQRRLETAVPSVSARMTAAEPGLCSDHSLQAAAPAVASDQPAVALQSGPAEPALPRDGAAHPPQPFSVAATEATTVDQPRQLEQTPPAESEPATEVQSSQPGTTETGDEGLEDVSSPNVQQADGDRCSPAAIGQGDQAAPAIDRSLIPSGRSPSPMPDEDQLRAETGAIAAPPSSIMSAAPGSEPPTDVAGTAAAGSDATTASPPAPSVDATACRPLPADDPGASQGPGLDEAHVPLQLAVGDQDDTVNITSASPRCNSPGAGLDHGLREGLGRDPSPSIDRNAAVAFAAVSQWVHDLVDHKETGAHNWTK